MNFLAAKKSIKGKKQGFTLVETLVAVSVMVITLILVIDVYISIINAEKVAHALANKNDSVRYALELMFRDVRAGTDFSAPGTNSISFKTIISGSEPNVTYACSDDTVFRNNERIIPENITINNCRIVLDGAYGISQPKVSIVFDAVAKVKGKDYTTAINTSMVPRYPYFIYYPSGI